MAVYVLGTMPRKVREVESDLKHAGFINIGGRGSHRKYVHPSGVKIIISGKPGADVKSYQEIQVAEAIAEANR